MTFTLRGYAAADLEALYGIALATGHAGGDAAHLYRDPRLMGQIYAAPYARLAPGLALVAEDQQGVAGYVVGALDTAAWERRLECDWWPGLRPRYVDPVGTEPRAWNADQRRAFMIHHPTASPGAVTDRYPGHLHLNLLPRLQRRGAGTQLFRTWLALAGAGRPPALHVGVNHANAGALQFWAKQGFVTLAASNPPGARTVWMGRG